MKKEQAINYLHKCVGSDRKLTVSYEFTEENLPAVIRLKGKDGAKDVPLADYKDKLLAISGDEVVTIGRLPLCDVQADDYEDNLISRLHVIWQKVGNKFRLINCGIYGTIALEKTESGLKKIEPQNTPWEG